MSETYTPYLRALSEMRDVLDQAFGALPVSRHGEPAHFRLTIPAAAAERRRSAVLCLTVGGVRSGRTQTPVLQITVDELSARGDSVADQRLLDQVRFSGESGLDAAQLRRAVRNAVETITGQQAAALDDAKPGRRPLIDHFEPPRRIAAPAREDPLAAERSPHSEAAALEDPEYNQDVGVAPWDLSQDEAFGPDR
ncbi:MAG: hypothetical protein AAGM38_04665 [Pseudomonadota bacterium]